MTTLQPKIWSYNFFLLLLLLFAGVLGKIFWASYRSDTELDG